MAFNPVNFKMPKRSKQERLLSAHGYTFGRMADGIMSIIPTQETYKKLYMIPEATPEEVTTAYCYCRYDVALYSEKDEKFSHWMERLGWLVRNEEGKLVPDVELPEF